MDAVCQRNALEHKDERRSNTACERSGGTVEIMMIPVPTEHVTPFLRWAVQSGLRFARCNQNWFTIYEAQHILLVVAWLEGRRANRYECEC